MLNSTYAHAVLPIFTESFLSTQSQANIKVPKTDPEYSKQLTKAVKDQKIACVHKVLEESERERQSHHLFDSVINAAINGVNPR